jgi:hypothetical protein
VYNCTDTILACTCSVLYMAHTAAADAVALFQHSISSSCTVCVCIERAEVVGLGIVLVGIRKGFGRRGMLVIGSIVPNSK